MTRRSEGRNFWQLAAGLGLAAGLIWGAIPAQADSMLKRMDIDGLTRAADNVVIAQVKLKDSKFDSGVGLIKTHYTLAVSETLKGAATPSLEMTVAGGEVPGLPVSENVTGQPTLFQGEKVLLFLGQQHPSQERLQAEAAQQQHLQQYLQQQQAAGKPAFKIRTLAADDPLRTSPVFVGGWQGCYAIVTDPNSGEEVATQSANDGALTEQSLAAVKALASSPAAATAAKANPLLKAALANPTSQPLSDEQILDNMLLPDTKKHPAIRLNSLKNEIRFGVSAQKNEEQDKLKSNAAK